MFLKGLKNRKNQKGQAVLIVLLSLSVVLIIVLYIMSRTVTDITLSSREEESMRAFSAAEAGIERALVIGSDIGQTTIGDATFSADVSDFGLGQNVLNYPVSLKSGEIATFWLDRPSETGFNGNTIKVCWGKSGTSASDTATPAIEVSIYYKDAGVSKVARAMLDPNSGRTVTNNFTTASATACTISGETYQFQATLNMATLGITNAGTEGVLQFMTVKSLYNTTIAHKFGIDVSSTSSLLPSQGVKVNADGSFANSNRSIEVYQMYPVVPSVFAYSVFSANGVTK